jgi:hypothetical protein
MTCVSLRGTALNSGTQGKACGWQKANQVRAFVVQEQYFGSKQTYYGKETYSKPSESVCR